jgi:carboxylate-amine ligase
MSHNQVTFATHVHLGMPSGDEAMRLMHELKLYLPLLIALSANSPYWHGEDTRFAAFRHRVLASSRTYGIPPDFESWHDFEHFAATLQRAEILSSIHDIHWDIRPRPQLGTLEVRVMDAQPTLTEALALAALLRAVTRYLQGTRGESEAERPLSPVFWWSLKDNCYAASRLGIDAKFIVSNEGDVASMLDLADDVLERIAPYADCAERRYLDRLRERLPHGLPYVRQRRIHAESGSLRQVVRTFVGDLRGDVA